MEQAIIAASIEQFGQSYGDFKLHNGTIPAGKLSLALIVVLDPMPILVELKLEIMKKLFTSLI
jgi:hypothetical protein